MNPDLNAYLFAYRIANLFGGDIAGHRKNQLLDRPNHRASRRSGNNASKYPLQFLRLSFPLVFRGARKLDNQIFLYSHHDYAASFVA